MNWVRRTVLGRQIIALVSRVSVMETDAKDLARRVTELEAKLFQLSKARPEPDPFDPAVKSAGMSPLGEFSPVPKKDFYVSPDRMAGRAMPVPQEPAAAQVQPARPPGMIGIFGAGK